METEIWNGIVYQGRSYGDFYEVSNSGKIRNTNTRKILKAHINKCGYYQVAISLGSRGRKKTVKLHKAVAETFICNPREVHFVNHIDGNKLNNNVKNLEWVTAKENTVHAREHGLLACQRPGYLHSKAKLSANDIIEIKKLHKNGHTVRDIGQRFGVHHSSVSRILNKYSTRPLYKNVLRA